MRLRLIKIAARVVEGAARIRVFLPTACPDRDVFRALAGRGRLHSAPTAARAGELASPH
jgi:hypothetical protein